jgi:hypothetical protein
MTAVRIASPGTHAEHIVSLRGVEDGTGQTYEGDRAAWYDTVQSGVQCYDRDPATGRTAYVTARISSAGNKFVQTVADRYRPDNLYALPRF